MRVLVTGAGGLLGGRLASLLHARGLEVIAAHRRTPPPPGPRAVRAELTEAGALERLFDAVAPDAVVHAAVLGRADLCEERPAEAERVNVRLPAAVARLCHATGARLVALSTDLVFSGDRSLVAESDSPAPSSVYGRTKLAGEDAVLAACPTAAIARVALVAGRGHGPRPTCTEGVAWAVRAGRGVRLFEDEHRTPVDPESVAEALVRLLGRPACGRFHLGGPERLSRLDLGRRVARVLGLDPARLEAARQSEYGGPDPRPPDVSLDTGRARRELGWEPRPLDDAIREGRPDGE